MITNYNFGIVLFKHVNFQITRTDIDDRPPVEGSVCPAIRPGCPTVGEVAPNMVAAISNGKAPSCQCQSLTAARAWHNEDMRHLSDACGVAAPKRLPERTISHDRGSLNARQLQAATSTRSTTASARAIMVRSVTPASAAASPCSRTAAPMPMLPDTTTR